MLCAVFADPVQIWHTWQQNDGEMLHPDFKCNPQVFELELDFE